jgi:hypothetical protein
MAEENKMKTTKLIPILSVAVLLGLGGVSTTRNAGSTNPVETPPQKITVIYGDVPVSLDPSSFQMPLSQLF